MQEEEKQLYINDEGHLGKIPEEVLSEDLNRNLLGR